MKSVEAIELIVQEFGRASKSNPPFLSLEEGFFSILEEVDKLTDVTRGDTEILNKELIKDAAIKTAANAFRFLVDLC